MCPDGIDLLPHLNFWLSSKVIWGSHWSAISQEVILNLIRNMCSDIALSKLLAYLLGDNQLALDDICRYAGVYVCEVYAFITHAPVHINDSGVCVQGMWNTQVKGQVTETHRLKVNSHCDTALLSQCMTSQWCNHSDHCCNHSDHRITIGHQ